MDAVRDAVDPAVYQAAEKLLESDELGDIEPSGGGALSTVRGGGPIPYEVWVGVVDGEFTSECDCQAEAYRDGDTAEEGDELCVHAVAVTLAALEEDFGWSSSATPPSEAEVPPAVRRYTKLAATLPFRRLAALVGELAATNRLVAARLMAATGQTPSETDIEAVHRAVDLLAEEATSGEWEMDDIVHVGREIANEIEVVSFVPATRELVALVEHAAIRWDELAGELQGAWAYRNEESLEEIGTRIRQAHVRMCEDLQPDPEQFMERMADIVRLADYESCLNDPYDYLRIIGPELAAELSRRGGF